MSNAKKLVSHTHTHTPHVVPQSRGVGGVTPEEACKW